MDNDETIEALKSEISPKLKIILDTIVLPEIKEEFVGNDNIYSNSYVESIRAYLDLKTSTLDIMIDKIPPEYGCIEESCAYRKIPVDIPSEARLSHFPNVGFAIAVYEQMDSGGAYEQLVDRIIAKASAEAKFLFLEGENVFEANKEMLLEDGITTIAHILLRQYEDISQITVLFSPSEVGVASTAKRPLDFVATSNSYYERNWSSSSSAPNSPSEKQQEEPSQEMVEECQILGIELSQCTENTILARERVRSNLLLSDEEMIIMQARQNEINNSIYVVGIGGAIAGAAAFITLRKIK